MTISDQPRTGTGAIPVDTFAARLVLVRMHCGYLTIKDAAARCGVNYGSWSNWERGIEPARMLEVVDKIAAGLGVDRNWLLFGGPLTKAEENRARWRPSEGMDTLRYSIPAGRRAALALVEAPTWVSTDRVTLASAA